MTIQFNSIPFPYELSGSVWEFIKEWNGIVIKEMEWNGIEWNGFSRERKGIEWNGMKFKNLVWML